MIADSRFTKKVDSYIALQRESSQIKSLFETELTYTLCDRDNITDKKGNYFMSFNLPYKSGALPTTSDMSKIFPELQQLNVDQIIITPIPASEYSEFIDGKTINFRVPVSGSATPNELSGVTLISSTYSSSNALKSESNILLGDNVVFLFSDDINLPYTGKTRNELDDAINNSTVTSWDPTGDYKDRVGAVSNTEIRDFYNTDQRPSSSINYAVAVDAGYPNGRDGYNYDIPCGFAVLDKGYMVITHPQIVNNSPWTSGFTSDGSAYKALAQINSEEGFVNFDSIYVTEVGLYNPLGELIAVAKLSEPVEKNYVNAITFEINLEM